MSKRKIGGVMASAFIAGALVCGSIFASGNQVMVGGSKQGKALWTDYCGMSKEVQGPVDTILFTQSPRTAKGDPYQNYPHYVPEGSRIVSYNLNTKELKVLTLVILQQPLIHARIGMGRSLHFPGSTRRVVDARYGR